MSVTIVPEPCRKELAITHWYGPLAGQRVRCGDVRQTHAPEVELCGRCQPLGLLLARAGRDATDDEFGPTWEDCLAWNLTLAALLNAAETAALDEYERTHRILLPDAVFDAFSADIQDPKPPTHALVDLFVAPTPKVTITLVEPDAPRSNDPRVWDWRNHEDDCRCEFCKVHA